MEALGKEANEGMVVSDGRKDRDVFIKRLQDRVDMLNELKPKFDSALLEVGAVLNMEVLRCGHSAWTDKVDKFFKSQTRGAGLTNELVEKYLEIGSNLIAELARIDFNIVQPLGSLTALDYIELVEERFQVIKQNVRGFNRLSNFTVMKGGAE